MGNGVRAADRIELVEQRADVKRNLAVWTKRYRAGRPIILLDAPSTSSANTSSSRGVSWTSSSAGGEGAVGSTTAASAASGLHRRGASPARTSEQCGKSVGERRVGDVECQPDRVSSGVLPLKRQSSR